MCALPISERMAQDDGHAGSRDLRIVGHRTGRHIAVPSAATRAALYRRLPTLIASYSSPEGLFWAKLSAASLMAIAPIVVFGWFSQKQLVQGLTFGAVK